MTRDRLLLPLGFLALVVGVLGMLWALSLASLAGITWLCRITNMSIC